MHLRVFGVDHNGNDNFLFYKNEMKKIKLIS